MVLVTAIEHPFHARGKFQVNDGPFVGKPHPIVLPLDIFFLVCIPKIDPDFRADNIGRWVAVLVVKYLY